MERHCEMCGETGTVKCALMGIDKDKTAVIYYNSWLKCIFTQLADMAQSVERRLGKAEVTGSIPVISFQSASGKDFSRIFEKSFLLYRSESCAWKDMTAVLR